MRGVVNPLTLRQRGTVLVFALVYLGLLAMAVAAVSEAHLFQVRITPALEARLQTRQKALGLIEQWLTCLGLEVPRGNPGTRFLTIPGCSHLEGTADEHAQAYLKMLSDDGGIPPRLGEAKASSAIHYEAVRYEVVVRASVPPAISTLHQGIVVLAPRSDQ